MVDAGPRLQAEEPFRRPLAGQEFMIPLVDVRRDEPGAFGIGARADHGRYARHIRRQPRRVQVADVRRRGDQHLAAQMAAFLSEASWSSKCTPAAPAAI